MTFLDSRDRKVTLRSKPKRIVSLAPNITETIFALKAEDVLIGRTDYCDFPEEAKNIPSIGTLYQPSIEKILELNPDLIIASTHFPNEMLTKLTELSMPVIIIEERNSIEGLYTSIFDIGQILDKNTEAKKLIQDLRIQMNKITEKIKDLEKPTVYYVISYGEFGDYTAGGDTFISDLIGLAGGTNVAKDSVGWNYSLEKLIEKNPSLIICSMYYNTLEGITSSTGYKELPAIKNKNIYTIDNDLIDRQGPRLIQGLEELAKIIHPESF